jgi:exodeoxyribonuclease-5
MTTATVSAEAAEFTLTEGQALAIGHLQSAIRKGLTASLVGPAGTGKSFLTGRLIERHSHLSIICATPTHKAGAVLRARVPQDIPVVTVAALLGLKPQHRGKVTIFVPDWDSDPGRYLRDADLLIVDESSMVIQQLATELVNACRKFDVTLVFVGDAAQLPPVEREEPDPADLDHQQLELDGAGTARGRMAKEFLDPPGGAAVLTEVVRHQGPVLQLATAIRETSSVDEITALWPTISASDPDSFVALYSSEAAWLEPFVAAVADPRWRTAPDRARAICWTNRSVADLTHVVRTRVLGPAAALHWLEGEVVSNGDAVNVPGDSLARPLAPSSCEWIVEEADEHEFELNLGTIHWSTPARGDARQFDVSSVGIPMQRLALRPLFAGPRQEPITVMVPRPGDRSWPERLSEIARQIRHIPPDQKQARRDGWGMWHELRSYTADLRSAAVLTVHRSQGSTFQQVWLHHDLRRSSGQTGIALHYTALTRAAKGAHLLRRYQSAAVEVELGGDAAVDLGSA